MYSFPPISNERVVSKPSYQENGLGTCHGLIGCPMFDENHVSHYQHPFPSGCLDNVSTGMTHDHNGCTKTPVPVKVESKPVGENKGSFCNGSFSSCEDPISTLCVGPISSTGSFPVEDTIPHEYFQIDHPLCIK